MSTQGARAVRGAVKAALLDRLPPLLPLLRAQWDRQAAFPPVAEAAGHDSPLPQPDSWWTYAGRPVDRWPLIEANVERDKVQRAEIDTTTTDDSIVYRVTYDVSLLVFTLVEFPDATDERENAVDVLGDLTLAVRIALLDRKLSTGMIVLASTYASVYGDPMQAKGQRWEVASRSTFQVRADERHTRAPVVTVGVGEQPEVDLEVSTMQ